MQVCNLHDAGAVLPRAAPPDAPHLPQAADRHEPEEPAAPQARGLAACATSPTGRFQPVLDDGAHAARRGELRLERGRPPRAALQRQDLLRAARRRAASASIDSDRRSCASSSSTRSRADELEAVARRLPAARSEVVWVQEEPANMGAWQFIEPPAATRCSAAAHAALRRAATRRRARRPGRTRCTRPRRAELVDARLRARLRSRHGRSRSASRRSANRSPRRRSRAGSSRTATPSQPTSLLLELETDKATMEIAAGARRRAPHPRSRRARRCTSATWWRASTRTRRPRRPAAAGGQRRRHPPPRRPRRRPRRRQPQRDAAAVRHAGRRAGRSGRSARRCGDLVDEHGLDPARDSRQRASGGRLTKERRPRAPRARRSRSRRPRRRVAPRRGGAAAPRRRPPPRRRPRRGGDEERVPMSPLRQRIAERLRGGAAHGGDPHHLQRDRHERGDGAARAAQGALPADARHRRSASCRSSRAPASRRCSEMPVVNAQIDGDDIVYRHVRAPRRRGRHRARPGGAGGAQRRRAVASPRSSARSRGWPAWRARASSARRPQRRHLHDLERRRLRLAALDADPEPAAERHPRHAQDREAAGRRRRSDRRSGR